MALVSQLPVPAVQEIAGKDYLVEKVPFPPVLQCPVTSFQRIPPRIIQFFLFHILGITFGSERFCHALVHRVVRSPANSPSAIKKPRVGLSDGSAS